MGLIDAQTLVIDQIASLTREDFAIHENGEQVGWIHTGGDAFSRFFTGAREFTVTEMDGTPVLELTDEWSFGRDTYQLRDGGGATLGTIRREISFLKKRVSFLPADGAAPVEVEGSAFSYEYAIYVTGEQVAEVSRGYQGIAGALFGADRYAVTFGPGVDPRLRQIIIGTVVAIDVMRRKDSRRSSS